VARFLVERGVNTARGKNGITPFHMACYRGHLDVVTFLSLEKGMNPRAIDGHGRTPLEVARRAQRDDVVAFLERIQLENTTMQSNCMTTSFATEDAPCGEVNCNVA